MFALIIPVLCVFVTGYTNKSKHVNLKKRFFTSTGAKNENTKVSGKIVLYKKGLKIALSIFEKINICIDTIDNQDRNIQNIEKYYNFKYENLIFLLIW